MRKIILRCICALTANLLLVSGVQAAPVTWTINDADFSGFDEGGVSGTFDYDANTNVYSNVNLLITAGGEVTADYTLDEALGRIYIVPGGGIADGSVLTADYTPTVNSREQVTTDQLGAKFGALRFISDNTDGAERDYYWPKVSLNPDGELALKSRDTVQEMGFAAAVSTRSGFSQVYIDGRAA